MKYLTFENVPYIRHYIWGSLHGRQYPQVHSGPFKLARWDLNSSMELRHEVKTFSCKKVRNFISAPQPPPPTPSQKPMTRNFDVFFYLRLNKRLSKQSRRRCFDAFALIMTSIECFLKSYNSIRDSKVHGANMGPTCVLSAPGGPHIGPINLAVRYDMGKSSKEHKNKVTAIHHCL